MGDVNKVAVDVSEMMGRSVCGDFRVHDPRAMPIEGRAHDGIQKTEGGHDALRQASPQEVITPKKAGWAAIDGPNVLSINPAAKRPEEPTFDSESIVDPLKKKDGVPPGSLNRMGDAADHLVPKKGAERNAEHNQSAGFKDADHLPDSGGVSSVSLDMLQNTHGVDDVICFLRIGETAGVSDFETSPSPSAGTEGSPHLQAGIDIKRADIRHEEIDIIPPGEKKAEKLRASDI